MDSINSLFAMRAEKLEDHAFLSCLRSTGLEEPVVTYGDFYKLCVQKSRIWEEAELPGNEVIAIYAENSLEFLLASFSAIFAGYVPLMLSLKLPFNQIKSLIDLSNCKLGVCSFSNQELQDFSLRTGIPWKRVEEFSYSRHELGSNFLKVYPSKVNGNDTALIMHTSGSTANPKLVPMSHKQIISNQERVDKVLASSWDSKTRSLCWLPLYHGFALLSEFLRNAFVGAQMVLDESKPKSGADLLQSMDDAQTNGFCAVPWVFESIAETIKEEEKRGESTSLMVLKKNKFLLAGGASLDPEAAHFFSVRQVEITNLFGLTEAAGTIMLGSGSPPLYQPIPSLGMDFIPSDNSAYEMVFNDGPSVIKSYLANESATKEKIRISEGKRTYLTGDLFLKKESGWSYIGRKDDLFKNKMGVIVNPLIIEQKLDQIPQIKKTCLLGKSLDLNHLFIELKQDDFTQDFDCYIWQEIAKINLELGPANRVFIHNVRILNEAYPLVVTQKGNLKRTAIENNISEYFNHGRRLNISEMAEFIMPEGVSSPNVQQVVLNSIQLLQDFRSTPEINASLIQLGFDSLGMMGLKKQLEELLHISIPFHVLLNCLSLNDLVNFIEDEIILNVNEDKHNKDINKSGLYEAKFQVTNFQYMMYEATKKNSLHPYRSESMLLQCPRTYTQAELTRAVVSLEKSHPTLKTLFDEQAAKMYLSPDSMSKQSLDSTIDLSSEQIAAWMQKNTSLVLDIYSGPLYKIKPLKLINQSLGLEAGFYILIVMHHIICDYLSMVILTRSLQEVLAHPDKDHNQPDYQTELAGRKSPTFISNLQASPFWEKKIPYHKLDQVWKKLTVEQLKGGTIPFEFADWDPSKLQQVLASNNISFYNGLLGSWLLSLFYDTLYPAWSLTPLSQRLNTDSDDLIGPFLQLAIVPAHIHPSLKLRDFLSDLSSQVSQIYQNMDSMPLSIIQGYTKEIEGIQNLFLYRSPSERFKLPEGWTCHRTEPYYNWSRFSI
ncbi:MAG: AMP-binding protein [Oligoflexales bacterium]